jgi:ABC-type proline/glycine betaine transport system permease subunit
MELTNQFVSFSKGVARKTFSLAKVTAVAAKNTLGNLIFNGLDSDSSSVP